MREKKKSAERQKHNSEMFSHSQSPRIDRRVQVGKLDTNMSLEQESTTQ